MAEVKNSFLKSKMNQDLDDRLIPNGEYRYANNISVGKSETDDIGTLKNVLGNELLQQTSNNEFLPGTETPNPNYIGGLECIGTFMDNQNNRMFQFLTNYSDPNPSQITYPKDAGLAPYLAGWVMKIVMYDFTGSGTYAVLVDGLFLNFAKNKEFKITGVNLIEGLLFWTDNRNQPRKININKALSSSNYYITEEQISVAKYAPVDPISLYRKVTATVLGVTTSTVFNVPIGTAISKGMTVISDDISGGDYIIVSDYDVVTGTVTLYKEPTAPTPNISTGDVLTFLISTMSDKSDVPSWPGDPAFLEDKYVRFSFRFKYDDNEYSLMAPFTQIAYIPKQKGFFIDGNETDAYRSTIVNWFENNINNIDLVVPLPDKVKNLTNNYKVQEIDILYKESDSTAIKVFETIPVSSINTPFNAENNYYIQPYQSQKPYKTLAEDQTTRVYDKVPVRAKAQESAGNRIIYGNYYDKYTSLSSINYNISVQPKSDIGTSFIEYPNHTLKKNRNYQVGFVIADKFGRQSPVILSSVDLNGTLIGGDSYAKGSTVYSSYEDTTLFENVREWFGDALILYLNTPIDQLRDISIGQPGLYAIPTSSSGFAITSSTITDTTYTFTLDPPPVGGAENIIPLKGNIMRGFYTDYVEVTDVSPTPSIPYSGSYIITTSGRVNDIYKYVPQIGGIKDIKFAYKYNPVGWYSYKIVVKQQEQDYYNVYLPGMLNGYPKGQTSGSQVVYNGSVPTLENGINITQFPVSETGNTSHIVLINDNINKVPRDLSEVGPDQKQYRSSVQLYGRVENTKDTITITGDTPTFSGKVIEINYTIGPGIVNADWVLIKPGDGIQCVQANIPVPNTTPPATPGATSPNPYAWLGNTVVVSNVVVGTAGTITISSPNWVLKSSLTNPDYVTFTITRAENRQYFPTRKADTVISIAYADEFNFIDSSENNLSGTAGLNFYQLQNKPLIGRVSTVNDIGVVAESMIPFLSVYETRPEQSLLEIFWETASTGLISDLNAQVLTGFKGPTGFDGLEYLHFENQDPNGADLNVNNFGQADSKYITSQFIPIGQEGFPFSNTTVLLDSVVDELGNNVTSNFGIEAGVSGANNAYRLFINYTPTINSNPFVFNYNANEIQNFTFTFFVTNLNEPATATYLSFKGRLSNIAPIISPSDDSYNILQTTTTFATFEAKNGSFTGSFPAIPDYAKSDLKWSIVSGNDNNYFLIEPYTGVLKLINPNVPLNTYSLTIRVQDAVNTTNGDPLLSTEPTFGTLFDDKTITVNVGDAPMPIWLRPNFTSNTLSGGNVCGGLPTPTCAMIYFGPNATPDNSYVPEIPGSGGTYAFIQNVEIVNYLNYYPFGAGLQPDGLRQGEYRVKVELTAYAPGICPPKTQASVRASTAIYFYKRKYQNPPLAWELTSNENNWGDGSHPFVIGPITASTFDDQGTIYTSPTKQLTTSFTIEAEDGNDLYEYAVGVRLINANSFAAGDNSTVRFYGNDANYSYPNTTIPFLPAQTNEYEYYTGVETLTGYTSGVPYQVQDATKGLEYISQYNTIASGDIISGNPQVSFTLLNPNYQIAEGLAAFITGVGVFGNGIVVAVNPANPAEVTVQLDPTPATSFSLVGCNLRVNTVFPNEFPDGLVGKLYVNTEEGTEIKRFYTDANFTQKWIPPVGGRYYNFITTKNYNPGNLEFLDGTQIYSSYPYYCALVNEDGEVQPQTGSTPNVQTAWLGQNPNNTESTGLLNYNYNLLYVIPPAPPPP